jgi:hypothetical protein
MVQVRIEAIIEIDKNLFGLDDPDERQFFIEIMNDKNHTNLLLWSNDIGDEIGSTFQFEWELINK